MNIDKLLNQANEFYESSLFSQAIECWNEVLSLDPNNKSALNNLGVTFKIQGKLDEAIANYKKILLIDPEHTDALNNLGIAYYNQGKEEESILHLKKTLSIDSNHVDALNNIGVVFKMQGKLTKAILSYNKAISIEPENAECHYNLGITLCEQGKLDKAISSYEKTLNIKPTYVNALINSGVILAQQGKLDKAISSYEKALSLEPNNTSVLTNQGIIFEQQGELNKAISNYSRILSIDPTNTEVHTNLGIALLTKGDMEHGWKEYEWRKPIKQDFTTVNNLVFNLAPNGNESEFKQLNQEFPLSKLLKNTSQIKDKIILIHCEQGLGDSIQFIRYIAQIQEEKASKIILFCQKSLEKLFEYTLFNIDHIITKGNEQTLIYDYQIRLMSLPLLFGTTLNTIPNDTPYIYANYRLIEKIRQQMNCLQGLKIGLVWQGNNDHANDQNRSIKASLFLKLMEIKRYNFISLQKKSNKKDIQKFNQYSNFRDFGPQLVNYTITAAIIVNLDVIISVDTSLAHLSGALGRPVWVMLPYNNDWRWMRDRDDSPWYPTHRIFRQKEKGNWNDVVNQIVEELRKEL